MSLEPGPHSTAIWCAFGGCSSIRHGSLRFSLVLILSRPSSSSGHGHMVSRCHQHSTPLCVVAKQMGQRLQSMKATLHFSEETLKSWIGILNSSDIFFLVFRHLSFFVILSWSTDSWSTDFFHDSWCQYYMCRSVGGCILHILILPHPLTPSYNQKGKL